ncbi:hypothetical protein GCM10022227_24790 [Streptomyces sedi]
MLRLWKNRLIGEVPATEATENTFFYLSKPRSRRAAVRILPVTIVGIEVMWCALLWNELTGEQADLFLVALIAVFVICMFMAASIALFNRPKSLVPPPRRADIGILRERFGKKRANRQTDESTDSPPT